jgi:hypothetical protein
MTVLEPLPASQSEGKSVQVSVYTPDDMAAWDNFVFTSKNATFLFLRNYMDYHSDRFVDHSLLFHQSDQLAALMPANINGDVLYTHGGLTYGGILSNYQMGVSLMLDIFEELTKHCKNQGVKKIVYKAIPSIYYSAPSEEDLYALFRFDAKLIGRNVSSCIYLPTKRRFDKKRRESVTKAKNHDLTVKQSTDFDGFMKMVDEVVTRRHGSKPAHTSAEMVLLASRFPDNIKLFGSFRDDEMLAGCLIYESKNVAHGQYAANLDEGRNLGAQDLIIDYLVNSYYKDFKFFDFGISTINLGQLLNEGLITHKESFGASAIVYDTYEIPIN